MGGPPVEPSLGQGPRIPCSRIGEKDGLAPFVRARPSGPGRKPDPSCEDSGEEVTLGVRICR